MYSFAGYTAENYELFRSLKKYKKDGFEILLAPCTCNSFLVILTIILTHFFYHNAGNQFGYQEPGDASAITAFAQKQSFDGNYISVVLYLPVNYFKTNRDTDRQSLLVYVFKYNVY